MQYFIAGPATVNMFSGGNLISTSKTMINNTITIDVSSEDIRGGLGNQLFGKYFHTSTFNMELEDTMFRFEWLAYAIGSNITYGSDILFTETVEVPAGGAITLSNSAVAFASETPQAWMYLPGSNSFVTVAVTGDSSNEVSAPEQFQGKTACIRYAYSNAAARTMTISSNIIPKEVTLVAKAQLFAGDVANIASSTRVGFVEITVDRFLLNGSVTLSLTSSGASTTPISGSALAVVSEGCEDSDGYYATITEILDNSNWYDNVVALVVPGGEIDINGTETATLVVNAYTSDGGYIRQPNTAYTFASLSSGTVSVTPEGVVSGVANGQGAISITITDYDNSPVGSVVVNVTGKA